MLRNLILNSIKSEQQNNLKKTLSVREIQVASNGQWRFPPFGKRDKICYVGTQVQN